MDKKKDTSNSKQSGATTPAASQSFFNKKSTSTSKLVTSQKSTDKRNSVTSVPKTKEEKYKEAFAIMDKDKSGEITKVEFRAFFDEHGIAKTWTHEQMDSMFDEIDDDHSGTIDINNFLSAFKKTSVSRDLVTFVNELLHEKPIQENEMGETEDERRERIAKNKEDTRLKREDDYYNMGPQKYAEEVLDIDATHFRKYQKAFILLDLNDNGDINEEELIFVLDQFQLGTGLKKQEVTDLFSDIDKDKDSNINFLDFLEALDMTNPNKSLLGIIAAIHSKSKEIKEFKFNNRLRIAKEGIAGLKASPHKPIKPATIKTKHTNDISDIQLEDSLFKKYNKVFDEMDIDGNGSVSKDEFEKVLRIYFELHKLPTQEIHNSFALIDQDNSGTITLYEFLKCVETKRCPLLVKLADLMGQDDKKLEKLHTLKKAQQQYNPEDPIPYARDVLRMPEFQRTKYHKAFTLIDLDNSGRITKQEFEITVKNLNLIKNPTRESIEEIYNSIDIDGSGGISLLEFWNALGGEQPNKKLAGMIDTIIRKEKDILAYIKKMGIKRGPTPPITPDKVKPPPEDVEKKLRMEIEALRLEIADLSLKVEDRDMLIFQKDSELYRILKQRAVEQASFMNIKSELEQKIADFEKEIAALRKENEKLLAENAERDKIKKMIEDLAGHVGKSSNSTTIEIQNQDPKIYFEKLQSEFDKGITERDELNKKIHELENKNKEFVEKNEIQEKDLATLRVESLNLVQTVNLLEQEKKNIQSGENDRDKRITQLEQQKEQASADLSGFKNELEKLQDIHANCFREVEKLNTQIAIMVLKEDYDKLVKKQEETQRDVESLRASEVMLKDQKAKLDLENSQIKERNDNLEKVKQSISEELSRLKSQLEGSNSKLEEKQSEIENLNKQVSTMANEAKKNGKEKEESSQENETLKRQIEHINKEKNSLEEEKVRLNSQLQESEKQKNEGISQNDKLTVQIEELRRTNQHELDDIKSLTNKMSSMISHEEVEKIKKEKSDLFHENDNVKGELERVKNEKHSLETEQSQLKKRVQTLENEKEDLNVNQSKLKNELEHTQAENSNHIQEVNKLKGLMENMTSKEETDKLQQSKDELTHTNNKLKKDLEDLQKQEQTLKTEQAISQQRIQELEKEKEELNVDLSKSKNELERIQVSNTNSQKEIDRLKTQISNMIPKEVYDEILQGQGKTQDDAQALRASELLLKNEKASLEAEKTQLKERVGDLEKSQEETSAELAKLKSQSKDLESKLEQKQQEIENLSKKVSGMTSQEDVDKIRKEKDGLNQEIENLKKENEHLKTQYQSHEIEHDQTKARAGDLEKQKDELNVNITKLKDELDNIKAKNTDLEKEVNSLKEDMSKMTSQEEAEKLVKEKNDLIQANDSLKAAIDKTKTEKSSAEEEQTHLKDITHDLEKKNQDAVLNNEKLKHQVSELTLKNEQGLNQIQSLKAEVLALTGKIEKVTKERDDQTEKYEKLRKEDENVQTQKGSLENEQALFKRKVQELEKQKEELTLKLNKSQNEIEKLQKDNEISAKEIERLNAKLADMVSRDQFEKLRQEQSSLKNDAQNLHNLELSLENQKARLEDENMQLKGRLDGLEKYKKETSAEIARLTSHLQDTESKLKVKQNEIQTLNNQISAMFSREVVDQLKKEKEELSRQIANSKSSISTLEGEKARLNQKVEEIVKQRDGASQEILNLKNQQSVAETQSHKDKELAVFNQKELEKLKKEIDRLTLVNTDLQSMLQPKQDTLAEEIEALRKEVLSQALNEREFLNNLLQNLSSSGSEGLDKNISQPPQSSPAKNSDSAEKINGAENELQNAHLLPPAELRKKLNEIKQLRSDLENAWEAKQEYIKNLLKLIERKAENAFKLINLHDTEPITKEDFIDVIQGCQVMDQIDAAVLFDELSQDGLIHMSSVVEKCGSDNSLPKYISFVDSVLAKEQDIVLYKKDKTQKLREAQSERAYLLLDYNGNEPIKKQDFIEIVTECVLFTEGSDGTISSFFDELDDNKDGDITLGEFVKNMSAENALPKYKKFFRTIVSKEEQIHDFKQKRRDAANKSLGRYQKAFVILNFNGLKPIHKPDFETIVKEFSLIPETSENAINALFEELDKDRDGELSIGDFLQCFSVTSPLFNHLSFADTIFNRESDIMEYKKSKGRKYTQDKCQKAFNLLTLNNTEPISKTIFIEALQTCSSTSDSLNSSDIEKLFQEIDKDGDGEVSLLDFLESVNKDYPSQKCVLLVGLILSNEQNLLAYKAKKAQQAQDEAISRNNGGWSERTGEETVINRQLSQKQKARVLYNSRRSGNEDIYLGYTDPTEAATASNANNEGWIERQGEERVVERQRSQAGQPKAFKSSRRGGNDDVYQNQTEPVSTVNEDAGGWVERQSEERIVERQRSQAGQPKAFKSSRRSGNEGIYQSQSGSEAADVNGGWFEREQDVVNFQRGDSQIRKARPLYNARRTENLDIYLTEGDLQTILQNEGTDSEAEIIQGESGSWISRPVEQETLMSQLSMGSEAQKNSQNRPTEQERFGETEFTRETNESGAWHSRGAFEQERVVRNSVPENANDHITRKARALGRFRDGEEEEEEVANLRQTEENEEAKQGETITREQWLGFKADQFLGAQRNKKASAQVREELLLCLEDVPDYVVDNIPAFSRPDRIGFLNIAMQEYHNKMRYLNQQDVKLGYLEEFVQEEKNELNAQQGRRRRFGVIGMICVIPFITNFHKMFYAGPQ